MGQAKSSQGKFAQDEVYPTHYLDNVAVIRPLIVIWTLRFDDQLNVQLLHSSLCELLENHGDWRKLGGRLRTSKDPRKLEMHIPPSFTEERPAVAFTHDTFAMSMQEHDRAKGIASKSSVPSMRDGAPQYASLAVSPTLPTTAKGFIDQDRPVLSLHVVSFNDATLVSLAFPHTVLDGISFSHLLKAWSLVMAKQSEKVPPLLGARDDLLYKIAEPPAAVDGKKAEWKMQSRLLNGFPLFKFTLYGLRDILREPKAHDKTIHIPKRHMDALHERAMADIQPDVASSSGGAVFVSKGDVLVAWLAKLVADAQPSPRGVSVLSALDLRSRLTEIVTTTTASEGVYAQNLLVGSSALLSKEMLAAGALGPLALEHRRELIAQVEEKQIAGYLREVRRQYDSGKDPNVLLGDWRDVLLIISNRCKVDILKNANLIPAVIKSHGRSASAPSGFPAYQHSFMLRTSPLWRNIAFIEGEDHDGDYWITGLFSNSVWRVVEKEMENLAAQIS